MKKKIVSICMLITALSLVPAIAMAVDDDAAADSNVAVHIETTSAEVLEDSPEASEQGSEAVSSDRKEDLPGAFGLWWREVKERVTLTFTFDPVKKAEREVKFAEERIALAEKIALSADEDMQDKMDAMLARAEELMHRVEEKRDAIAEKKDERAEQLMKSVASHQMHREEVLDTIEAMLPEDRLERFLGRREALSEQSQRLLQAMNNESLSEDVRAHVEEVKMRIEAHAAQVKQYNEERKALQASLRDTEDADAVREQLEELRESHREDMDEARVELKYRFREERRINDEDSDDDNVGPEESITDAEQRIWVEEDGKIQERRVKIRIDNDVNNDEHDALERDDSDDRTKEHEDEEKENDNNDDENEKDTDDKR